MFILSFISDHLSLIKLSPFPLLQYFDFYPTYVDMLLRAMLWDLSLCIFSGVKSVTVKVLQL